MAIGIANTRSNIATLTVELSSGGTEAHVSTAAPEAVWGKPFTIRLGEAEFALVTETGASGASPWTVVRNSEPLVGGAGATSHPVGTRIYLPLSVGVLETLLGSLPAASVGPVQLQPGAVAAAAIQSEAVGPHALANEAVETPAIAAGAVTAEKLGTITVSFYERHTWVIPGEVKLGTLPGPEIELATDETVEAVRAGFGLASGTKAKFEIKKAGSGMTGFTALEAVSSEAKHVEPTAVSVTNGQLFQLHITEVSGTPEAIYVTLTLKKTITL